MMVYKSIKSLPTDVHLLTFIYLYQIAGYGSMVPETPLGKVLVVIYATLGIPLCLVGFAQLGKVLSNHMTHLTKKIFNLLKVKPSKTVAKIVEFVLAIFCGLIVHLVIPSLVFFYVENWTYLDTFYWLFVTLSTIGFGDIVPGKSCTVPRNFIAGRKNNKLILILLVKDEIKWEHLFC